MNLYRIAKATYASDLTGTGGLYEGGRWHNKGTQILYTSSVISLAMLEVLSHWQKTPVGLVLITLEVPDTASILELNAGNLPSNWQSTPSLQALRDIGSSWINDAQQWVLKVPSTHSPTEFNYLLDPLHPEHKTLKLISIESHPFDPRLN